MNLRERLAKLEAEALLSVPIPDDLPEQARRIMKCARADGKPMTAAEALRIADDLDRTLQALDALEYGL